MPGQIQEFLAHHQLDDLVDDIVGCVRGKPELMKPNPDCINRALAELARPAPQCAFSETR
jgi:beta-phosphoglucomutase-like phosphatase (HAD superfamily)